MKIRLLIACLGTAALSANAENQGAMELTNEPPAFTQVDTNQDGLISKQEASSFSALELVFENADSNQDGMLDSREFKKTENDENKK